MGGPSGSRLVEQPAVLEWPNPFAIVAVDEDIPERMVAQLPVALGDVVEPLPQLGVGDLAERAHTARERFIGVGRSGRRDDGARERRPSGSRRT